MFISINTTDSEFTVRVIKWLKGQNVKPKSTTIIVGESDPYAELALREAQIEGMTQRIYDLEYSNEVRCKR